MKSFAVLLVLLAPPFWETTSPDKWTEEQLQSIFAESPWAQVAAAQTLVGPAPPATVYLASAEPMRLAEAERRRRLAKKRFAQDAEEDTLAEYEEYVQAHRDKVIVVAIAYHDWGALADASEAATMQKECRLKVGRKKYRLEGYFPPTPSDPYLRLVFPRAAGERDKRFSVEFYLPGAAVPFREVEFELKDLVYRGRPSY